MKEKNDKNLMLNEVDKERKTGVKSVLKCFGKYFTLLTVSLLSAGAAFWVWKNNSDTTALQMGVGIATMGIAGTILGLRVENCKKRYEKECAITKAEEDEQNKNNSPKEIEESINEIV